MGNKLIIALLSIFVLYAFCNVVKAAPIDDDAPFFTAYGEVSLELKYIDKAWSKGVVPRVGIVGKGLPNAWSRLVDANGLVSPSVPLSGDFVLYLYTGSAFHRMDFSPASRWLTEPLIIEPGYWKYLVSVDIDEWDSVLPMRQYDVAFTIESLDSTVELPNSLFLFLIALFVGTIFLTKEY